ncbi:hypothetical protein DPMN_129760 [Dreissena polymorpha]|uniref:Uncharacterized protein n=1 Tax=Dreissena polymorpha TaxID=45954 RepID=A0A9D4H3U1_DREPO|nr:hypothetical protein DPMN_129760 [Dreissena polymorpha]
MSSNTILVILLLLMGSGLLVSGQPMIYEPTDYFGGVGGSDGLPVFGGAGAGEVFAEGINYFGQGEMPLNIF